MLTIVLHMQQLSPQQDRKLTQEKKFKIFTPVSNIT